MTFHSALIFYFVLIVAKAATISIVIRVVSFVNCTQELQLAELKYQSAYPTAKIVPLQLARERNIDQDQAQEFAGIAAGIASLLLLLCRL